MGEFDGRIFICSANEIYVLVPVAIEKQVRNCFLVINGSNPLSVRY